MKPLSIKEVYKALAIDEEDVKTFRQLTINQVQIIFKDGHKATFKIKPGKIIKR